MADPINVLLLVVSLAYLAFLAVVEAVCVLGKRFTISNRIQKWIAGNVQIALALAAVAGWLLAHFSGTPG